MRIFRFLVFFFFFSAHCASTHFAGFICEIFALRETGDGVDLVSNLTCALSQSFELKMIPAAANEKKSPQKKEAGEGRVRSGREQIRFWIKQHIHITTAGTT